MEYSCHAFHQDLPNGKSSGQLRLDASGFNFTVAGKVVRMPFQGCQLKLGGAGDRLLFITHPLVKDWSFYCSDKALLSNPALKDHPELVAQVQRVRRSRMTTFAIVATIAVVIVGSPVLVLTNMSWVTAKVAQQIPVEWENSLGQSAIAQYTIDTEMLAQNQTDALLLPLVQPLLTALPDSRFDYHFYIAADPTENAFALPGGYVVIHSQLILTADTAEQLLGVLAHEIMHVEQQHGVRSVIATAGVYALVSALFGDVSGISALIINAAPFLLRQSYSRGFERDADIRGFRLLVNANIDPKGLPAFFAKLMAKDRRDDSNNGGGKSSESLDQALQFLSTHPASAARVAYLSELAQEHQGNYRDFSEQFAKLQQAVKEFVDENQ